MCLLRLNDGALVHCTARDSKRGIDVDIRSRDVLTPIQRAEIRRQIRTCFRLDEDLSAFHAEVRKHRSYTWITRSGSGRLLRAPTVFEDIVKMLCTTNCTWALTEVMVGNLVSRLGEAFTDGLRAFPTPAALAGASEAFLRKEIRSGYRSPYLIEFAEQVASGEVDIESWRSSPLATADLFNEVRSIKGMGPYATGNLLRLLGRYDYLALDSWVRSQFAEVHHNGRRVSDRTIERRYEQFGEWKGLFFWFEMTKHWLNDKFPL
jgi:3-methyladenine DNA glycosylase/8-oxoguanine DNA glycosylase